MTHNKFQAKNESLAGEAQWIKNSDSSSRNNKNERYKILERCLSFFYSTAKL